jgi:hypothetical protein
LSTGTDKIVRIIITILTTVLVSVAALFTYLSINTRDTNSVQRRLQVIDKSYNPMINYVANIPINMSTYILEVRVGNRIYQADVPVNVYNSAEIGKEYLFDVTENNIHYSNKNQED